MLLRSRARRCINAPPSASTSTRDTQHPHALIHLLPTLTAELLNRIMSHLYPADLEEFTLSCWAARDMVYSAHVTKLTFIRPHLLQWPRRAAMSQRYPAVSHIVITWRGLQGFSESCDSLISQNSKHSMRGITQLDISLTDAHIISKRATKQLSRLLGIFTSLQQLVLSLQVGRDAGVYVCLTLFEQAPGWGLQQHQHLLDQGLDLEHILDTAACITQLRQLVFSPDTHESPQYGVLCNALPKLSALRDLTLRRHFAHLASPASHPLSMLTRLQIDFDGFASPVPPDLDLPALKELTLRALFRWSSTFVSFPSSLHSLMRLSLSCIHLSPDNGMWGLTSLKHLSLDDCVSEGTVAALSSSLQALPSLTCLHVARLTCMDSPPPVSATASLHLDNAPRLSELKVSCYEHDALQHIPTSLTSLSVYVQMNPEEDPATDDDRDSDSDDDDPDPKAVPLPLTWQRCTQLRRLTLAAYCDWGQVLPLLAQLTTLEHLELRNRPNPNTVDASCLDNLTQLTCLSLDIGVNLRPPTWPLLSQSARLQQLAIWCCLGWPTLPLPSSLVRLRVVTNSMVPLPGHLSSCRSLQHLTVKSWNALDVTSDIACLAPLTNLRYLSLCRYIEVSTEDMAAIAQLTNLRHLVLGGFSSMSRSTSISCLRALNQLTMIELGNVLYRELAEELPKLQQSGLLPRLLDVERIYGC